MTSPASPLRITVAQTGDSFDCFPHENLLTGMLRLGRKGIPVGCVNGGCGVCKVRILEGAVQPLGPVSRAHVSQAEEEQGYTLACRVAPLEPVRLEVTPLLRKPFLLSRSSTASAPTAVPA